MGPAGYFTTPSDFQHIIFIKYQPLFVINLLLKDIVC